MLTQTQIAEPRSDQTRGRPVRRRVRGGPAERRHERAVTATRTISHARLDRRLAILARRPERFAADALRLCAALDARRFELEITDPSAWRGGTGALRVAVEKQFSAEVDNVRTMGREEELRLALRIEFARLRLERALEPLGLTRADLRTATLPPEIERRQREWHALRLEMVERNLYLVLINVERYRHTSADRSDLVQAAAATMLRAVDGFDWRRGVLFRTYAVYWLSEGFRNHLYNFNSTVRVPVYLQKSLDHDHTPPASIGEPSAGLEELAHATSPRGSLVAAARTAGRRIRSLDAPLDSRDGSRTLGGELALRDDEGPYSVALEDVSVASGVEAVLAKLTERERRVVQMRFGIGCPREHIYAEVAAELGVSLERARQIFVRALAKMRTPGLRKMLAPLVS